MKDTRELTTLKPQQVPQQCQHHLHELVSHISCSIPVGCKPKSWKYVHYTIRNKNIVIICVAEPLVEKRLRADDAASRFDDRLKPPEEKKRKRLSEKKQLKSKIYFERKEREAKQAEITAAAMAARRSQPCSFYQQGRCSKGSECTYSHDTAILKSSLPCRFFAQGRCGKGTVTTESDRLLIEASWSACDVLCLCE